MSKLCWISLSKQLYIFPVNFKIRTTTKCLVYYIYMKKHVKMLRITSFKRYLNMKKELLYQISNTFQLNITKTKLVFRV